MKKLLKFFSLDMATRLLVVEASLWFFCVTVASKVVPYRRWQPWLESLARPGQIGFRWSCGATRVMAFGNEAEEKRRVTWAVDRVGRLVPWHINCLSRAWVTFIMLRRRAILAELCLGVLRNKNGGFQAHAWVESSGLVVIGNVENLDQYQRLTREKK